MSTDDIAAVQDRAVDPGAAPTWWLRLQVLHWRYGLWLPILAITLGAGAAAWWHSGELQAVAALRLVHVEPPGPGVVAASLSPDVTRMRELRALLGPVGESAAAVRQLVLRSHPHLSWQRADFAYVGDPGSRITRLQIVVPVDGEYVAVRQALHRLLAQTPNLSLDELQFRRGSMESRRLDVRVRMSLWLKDPEAGVRP